LRGVTKSRGSFVLGPVNVEFRPGVTALLGANGAGKTTLMRLAVGILAPDEGDVVVADQAPGRRTGSVGYLPQDFAGPRNVRVSDYLRFIAWCRSRRNHRFDGHDVDRALARVGLEMKAEAKLGTLSGGMVRRVGIAQALIGNAGIVVLDEPTAGLDPLQRRELRALFEDLGAETTVVLSTHLSEDVAAVASHVTVLHDGAMVHDGSVESLIALGGASQRSGESVERGFLAVIGGAGDDRR
jgi:ABC-2 type transport system ATP-binding protein